MIKLYSVIFFVIISQTVFSQADDPCGAPALTVGASCSMVTASNAGYSNTSGVPAPGCGSYSNKDGWYTIVAPASGNLTIQTSAGTMTDADMALYSGTCASLSVIGCDDLSGPGIMPELSFSGLTGGATYYLRFWKYGGGTGNFSICAFEPTLPSTPANDDPCSATNLTVGTSCVYTTGTNVGATATSGVPAPGCSSYAGGDVWFTFTVPASGIFEINTAAGGITDAGMALYTGTCGSLSLLACDDDSGPSLMPYISTSYTPGTQIWIRVFEYGDDVSGTFQICVQEPALGTENTDCATATQICTTGTFDDNSSGDGAINDLNGSNHGCLTTNEHQSSWYYFQISTSGTLTFSINPATATDDFDFAVWGPSSTCPPSVDPIRCSYSAADGATGLNTASADLSEDAAGNRWVKYMDVLAGEQYVLCVDNFSASNSGFTFSFGGTATIDCTPIPLPVVFSEFTGYAAGPMNVLSWTTASEINAHTFSIEKSKNGLQFSEAGEVAASGNSSSAKQYSFSDFTPYIGDTYYRLREIDLSGEEHLSETILISNTQAADLLIYPNPTANGIVQLHCNIPSFETAEIKVIAAHGELVFTKTISANSSRLETIVLPAKGIYIIIVQIGEMKYLEKVTY